MGYINGVNQLKCRSGIKSSFTLNRPFLTHCDHVFMLSGSQFQVFGSSRDTAICVVYHLCHCHLLLSSAAKTGTLLHTLTLQCGAHIRLFTFIWKENWTIFKPFMCI